MYACLYIYICIYIHIYIYCVCLFTYAYIYVCACACVYICTCVCMYVCMNICMYVCKHTHTYLCVCWCVCVCIFVRVFSYDDMHGLHEWFAWIRSVSAGRSEQIWSPDLATSNPWKPVYVYFLYMHIHVCSVWSCLTYGAYVCTYIHIHVWT
jgi:hypothetical protein